MNELEKQSRWDIGALEKLKQVKASQDSIHTYYDLYLSSFSNHLLKHRDYGKSWANDLIRTYPVTWPEVAGEQTRKENTTKKMFTHKAIVRFISPDKRGHDCFVVGQRYQLVYGGVPDSDNEVKVWVNFEHKNWHYVNVDCLEEVPTETAVPEPQHTFIVGDHVQVRTNAADFGDIDDVHLLGSTGMIIEDRTDDGDEEYPYKVNLGSNNEDYNAQQLKLIRAKDSSEQDNTMSNVKNDPLLALEEITLDADTRLLRELGFENGNGLPTDKAGIVILRRAWNAQRVQVATDLRTAIANEANDTKTNNAETTEA